jgi:4-hydroxybenzoate polyprenyltransferase
MFRPLATYARMIKLSHSIFSMPFALAAALIAWRDVPFRWVDLALIAVCLVTARASAMGFNRLVDARYDAMNPRTAGRELPSGQISSAAAWAFTLGSAGVFAAASWALSPLAALLAPVALAVVWGYSLTKRFTALCHLFLGAALALAPTGVWVALTGTWGVVPALLSLAVGTWVAGFDIIYSCQDAVFDRAHGLRSIPAALGLRNALVASAALHVVTVGCLVALPLVVPLAWPWWVGVAAITGVLGWEHAIVTPTDLSRVDKAFFDLNGWVSLLFLAFVAIS